MKVLTLKETYFILPKRTFSCGTKIGKPPKAFFEDCHLQLPLKHCFFIPCSFVGFRGKIIKATLCGLMVSSVLSYELTSLKNIYNQCKHMCSMGIPAHSPDESAMYTKRMMCHTCISVIDCLLWRPTWSAVKYTCKRVFFY